ncbi:hypothetical protein FSP39_009539 [Pinctada imbricata]|uniref:Uncharacterized protein n=1 Tax=Pinctada imbricata TaxID=66713 RepID=A0AA88Y4D5_PINIB|nr:hypothetical protein FSP39_009539 [Pinctada imbricata]
MHHSGSFLPSRSYAEQAKKKEESTVRSVLNEKKSVEKAVSAKKGPTPTRKTRFWEHSGDLVEKEKIDKSEIFYPYKGLENQLEQAPEHIRKLATLEFCDNVSKEDSQGCVQERNRTMSG